MDIIESIYKKNEAFVENENFAGVKKVIVDNYSDDVHFVYELLQNADDASATEISFELRKDKLLVVHNGIPFSEKDLVAICSISKGTKSGDYTKIGRFGIGFKSVFVYTDSPQIYSGEYSFEIRELVLPSKIPFPNKIPKDKTSFIIPFNASKTKKTACENIRVKLEDLADEAILFLKNIVKIDIRIALPNEDVETFDITKSIISEEKLDNDEVLQRLCINDSSTEINYRLLTKNNIKLTERDDDGKIQVCNQSIKIAFTEDDDGICPCSDWGYSIYENLYVFFPTRIPSNCEFLIHAPFITKSSRDTIALNNEANRVLKNELGSLIADSMYIFAERKLLTLDLIDRLYYSDHKDEEIWKSHEDRLHELISQGKELIPCEKNISKAIDEVLFTQEDPETFSTLRKLLGNPWLAEFYGLPKSFEICYIENSCEFYYYLAAEFECKELELQEIVDELDAHFYSDKTSQWIVDFINLFVVKSNLSYNILVERVDEFPLIRKKDGRHIYPKNAYNVFLNNGTLDEEVLSDSAVTYLYEQVYKIKNYSVELGDAKKAIKQIKNIVIDSEFDEYCELLSKVITALKMSKLSSSDIEHEAILLVQNQKNGKKTTVIPKTARLGTWVRANGDLDLYTLLKGVDVDLIDPRYYKRFDARDLKLLGCSEGLDYYDVPMYSYFKSLGFWDCWSAKHIRPLPGKANNRQFKPLQQLKYVPEILEAPMTIEKSILILRLAKEYDNQILDWIEWSSRADYSQNASFHDYALKYSAFGLVLHTSAWLYDKKYRLVKPGDIEEDNLAPEYKKHITSDIAEKLGIRKSKTEELNSVIKVLEDNGYYAIPMENKEEFEEFLRRKQQQEEELELNNDNQITEPNQETSVDKVDHSYEGMDFFEPEYIDDKTSEDEEPKRDSSSKPTNHKIMKTGHPVIDNIIAISEEVENESSFDDIEESVEIDDDELIPRAIDYEAQKKKKEKHYAAEIKLMQHKDDLQKIAMNSKKYSFLWFKTLLEMESLTNGDNNSNRQEVSITFTGTPEREKTRTLVLKNPDSHIPAFIEDLADMPLYFYEGDKETKITIDVASVRSYTLRVKLKNADELNKINLSKVTSVKLEARSPAFLLEELRKQFNALPYEDSFDMRANLCENIAFVFGPPGTGKTTYLANKLLINLMKQTNKCRVLVLTPTNKAADVLTRRIMECSGSDVSYENWLVRFGSTSDEDIENSNVYFHKDYDIDRCDKCVTVTTIDRFPYDFFMPQNKNVKLLQDVDWDLIVFDEASMIPIAKIIYPLYKKKPNRFVIAGDPFQIEPIVSNSLWKDENIYTLVHLDSFVNPQTVPHKFKIITLGTQYRSIPAVGDIFSKFAYDGRLSHFRKTKDQKKYDFGDDLAVDTLNIIKFPVSKFESIYKAKQLNRSSYHIYSALFTYEYAMFLAQRIRSNNPSEICRIGIIAPYRAEADLIHKLISAEKLPKAVDIQVGTIHGFQGDECDIVIAVFNAPPGMTNSENMFLNKKTIMNVAISRARDYLFVIMPNDKTERIENLVLVKKIERLIKQTAVWNEFNSHDIEKVIFDDPLYLEKNSFATSHQSVNVYGLPENKYEIRAEDSAVDIQVHKTEEDSFKSSKTDLSIVSVPKELQKDAFVRNVDGDIKGEYYIALYDGKLSQFTTETMNQMYFVFTKNNRPKHIPIKVDENNQVIYITKSNHQFYKSDFEAPILNVVAKFK